MDTKGQFVKAMFALLNKYPIDKITVDMIAEESGLSRASFYRHFLDKYHLMTMSYAIYADNIQEKERGKGNAISVSEKTLHFMRDNQRAFENMFKMEGYESFYKFLYARMLHRTKETYMKAKGVTDLPLYEMYVMELYVSGIVHCIDKWVKRGMDLDPKELARAIDNSIPDMIKELPAP